MRRMMGIDIWRASLNLPHDLPDFSPCEKMTFQDALQSIFSGWLKDSDPLVESCAVKREFPARLIGDWMAGPGMG